MITNIVDQRKRRYRWKAVHVIAEATWHDNSVADADQAEQDADSVDYDEWTASASRTPLPGGRDCLAQ